MKVLVLILFLLGAAGIATVVRYGSLHPCEWLDQDTASETGFPALVAQARVRAAFFLEGITEPGAADCLIAWWDLKANGAKAKE